MELSGYLVIKKGERWKSTNARFCKTKPSLSPNEIAVKIECEIPDQLFTRPELKFKIKVPKEAVPQREISAEVIGNVEDLIKQNMGFDVRLISEVIESTQS